MQSTAPRGPISSSAPPSNQPMFRAKKKKPGDEAPQNNGRMTGPPMQKGPGQDSMFANGRFGQGNPPATPNYPQGGPGPARAHGQPQYMAPATPNYPQQGPGPRGASGQPQGMHPRGVPTGQPLANGRTMMADGRKPMMADGDSMMGNPSPIGGAPDDQDTGPDMDDMAGGPPEGSPAGEMPIIKPEALAYHDDAQSCSGCMFMTPDSQCKILQMQISPTGGCNAFEAKSGEGDQGPVDTGAGFSQNDEGTSGAPSLG